MKQACTICDRACELKSMSVDNGDPVERSEKRRQVQPTRSQGLTAEASEESCSNESSLSNEATNFLSCNARMVNENTAVASSQVEHADCNEPSNEPTAHSWIHFLYSSIDCLIAAVIVGPMVVAHWRGIWLLMDYQQTIFSGWRCLGVGLSLHLLFGLMRQPLHDKFAGGMASRGRCSRLCLRVGRTAYIYLFSVACNCHWRGLWNILNDYFGLDAAVPVACFTSAVLGDLVLLRCTRNLLAPPFLVSLDSAQLVFRFPTRYRLVANYAPTLSYRLFGWLVLEIFLMKVDVPNIIGPLFKMKKMKHAWNDNIPIQCVSTTRIMRIM